MNTSELQGVVVSIRGTVVDVRFERNAPQIGTQVDLLNNLLNNLLNVGSPITGVVHSHLGDRTVRLIAVDSTRGLQLRCRAVSTNQPLSVPVGNQLLGRVVDLKGLPLDGAGPIETTERFPLHRQPPLDLQTEDEATIASPYQLHEHLLQVAIREYLYIMLYELMLDSLASEHGMRLIASETARKWIDESAQTVQLQVSAVRRENSTQEVLDIVSASRKRTRL